MIEQIEELYTQFDALGFTHDEAPRNTEINVDLLWTAQDIATNVTDRDETKIARLEILGAFTN